MCEKESVKQTTYIPDLVNYVKALRNKIKL